MINPSRLYSALLNTGLQQKDNPLYQVIRDLIKSLIDLSNQSPSSGAGTAINTTVINLASQSFPGFDGLDGEDGFIVPGPKGTDGVTGVQGPIGPVVFIEDGIDGNDGFNIPVQGPQGIQGIQGPVASPIVLFVEDGLDGEQGFPGISSPTGTSITFIQKTSDESVSNNTLQDDNQLKLAVGVNEIWRIQLVLFIVCAADTPDISITFTIPIGATLSYVLYGQSNSSTTVDGAKRLFSNYRVLTALSLGTIATATTPSVPVLITGWYTGGVNAGTLQLQWAQTNTDAGNPVTVKADSWLEAVKVG